MEYSPDRSQGKSPSRLRLDQVQRRGPPATPHDIINSALSELEWLLEFQDTNHKRFLTSLHIQHFQLDFPWNSIFTSSSHTGPKLHKDTLKHTFSPKKTELKHYYAVALAQAKKYSLGERLSRSGEPVSPRRDTNSGKMRKPGRTLAQARMVCLDEIVSRSGDSSSPRRDFAQEQRCVSWCFRSGESHLPRRKYQVTNLFPYAVDQFSFT